MPALVRLPSSTFLTFASAAVSRHGSEPSRPRCNLLATTAKYLLEEHDARGPDGIREGIVAVSWDDGAVNGDVMRPLPCSASLAICKPATAQQLGIAWGVPRPQKFITYTCPGFPHALCALLLLLLPSLPRYPVLIHFAPSSSFTSLVVVAPSQAHNQTFCIARVLELAFRELQSPAPSTAISTANTLPGSPTDSCFRRHIYSVVQFSPTAADHRRHRVSISEIYTREARGRAPLRNLPGSSPTADFPLPAPDARVWEFPPTSWLELLRTEPMALPTAHQAPTRPSSILRRTSSAGTILELRHRAR